MIRTSSSLLLEEEQGWGLEIKSSSFFLTLIDIYAYKNKDKNIYGGIYADMRFTPIQLRALFPFLKIPVSSRQKPVEKSGMARLGSHRTDGDPEVNILLEHAQRYASAHQTDLWERETVD